MSIYSTDPGLYLWVLVNGLMVALPAVVGAVLARRRGRVLWLGLVLGLLLSWVGVIVVLIVGGTGRAARSERS